MKWFRAGLCLICFFAALPAGAQDAAALWNGISQAAFDPSKSANVLNLSLIRDRIHITLEQGTIEFTKPVDGKVFGAAFEGKGMIQLVPPNPLEAQQLNLLTGRRELNLNFSKAAFCFSDSTFDQISKHVKWSAIAASGELPDLYQKRQQAREDDGSDALARLFQAVLSANPKHDSYFLADLKTDGSGWIEATDDAAQLEDIEVGRWRSLGPLQVFDTWAEFPANDGNPMALDENPLAKDDFLPTKYQVDATVTGGADLSATTAVTLQYRELGERALVFHLDANLRVTSVKDERGHSLPFFQPRSYGNNMQRYGDYLVVVLPQPTVAGANATLTFAYAGNHFIRKVGSGNFFCPSYGWYPSGADSFATRAGFDITFHSPKKFMLTSIGEKVSDRKEKRDEVTEWKSTSPVPVAGFAFGDFKEYDTKAGPTEVQVLANANPDNFLAGIQTMLQPTLPGDESAGVPVGTLDPSATIKTMGTEVANSLRVFDSFFGPYPYTKLSVTNIPYTYGQGWPTLLYISALSFLDATQRHVLGLPDNYQVTDFFRAHETSHQWWGQLVGWKSYHDQWLSEGFAQFSGNLYVEFRESPAAYLNQLKQDKRELLETDHFGHVYDSLGPIWMGRRLSTSRTPDGYTKVIYDKGGLVVNMLRMMMLDPRAKDPDAAFQAMMQDFVRTYANKAASTEDFERIVNKHMTAAMDIDHNHTMDWFFHQYVYGTGIPDYTFSYQLSDAGNGHWRVNGTLSRTGVSPNWKDILPLYLHLGKGEERLGWIRATQPKTTFTFVLGRKPDKLTVNDEEDILATIRE